LYPNIFYFLISILPVFANYVACYACVTKRGNLLDKKQNLFSL